MSQISGGGGGLFLAGGEVIEIFDEAGLHFFARDDGVYETAVEEEFGGLKTGGQFGLGGVFDDAGAGETDHGAGFGNNEVAYGGEAGHDAGHGGVGENAD